MPASPIGRSSRCSLATRCSLASRCRLASRSSRCRLAGRPRVAGLARLVAWLVGDSLVGLLGSLGSPSSSDPGLPPRNLLGRHRHLTASRDVCASPRRRCSDRARWRRPEHLRGPRPRCRRRAVLRGGAGQPPLRRLGRRTSGGAGGAERLIPVRHARFLLDSFVENARLAVRAVHGRGWLQDLAWRRAPVEEEDVHVHAGQHREEAKEAERVADLGRPFLALAS